MGPGLGALPPAWPAKGWRDGGRVRDVRKMQEQPGHPVAEPHRADGSRRPRPARGPWCGRPACARSRLGLEGHPRRLDAAARSSGPSCTRSFVSGLRSPSWTTPSSVLGLGEGSDVASGSGSGAHVHPSLRVAEGAGAEGGVLGSESCVSWPMPRPSWLSDRGKSHSLSVSCAISKVGMRSHAQPFHTPAEGPRTGSPVLGGLGFCTPSRAQ